MDQISLARAGPVLDRCGCQWGGLVVLLNPLSALKLKRIKDEVQFEDLALTRNGAHVPVSDLLDPVCLRSWGLTTNEADLCMGVLKRARWPGPPCVCH